MYCTINTFWVMLSGVRVWVRLRGRGEGKQQSGVGVTGAGTDNLPGHGCSEHDGAHVTTVWHGIDTNHTWRVAPQCEFVDAWPGRSCSWMSCYRTHRPADPPWGAPRPHPHRDTSCLTPPPAYCAASVTLHLRRAVTRILPASSTTESI